MNAMNIKRLLVAAVVLLLVDKPFGSAWAKEEAPLVQAADSSRTVLEILQKLDSDHYRDLAIDDRLSTELLDNYIDTLDGGKSYFMQSDIDEFRQWQFQLDDSLAAGDLSQGYAIFNRFRQRLMDRMEANIVLLKSDYVFDFKEKESLTVDPKTRTWMVTPQEYEDYWRKRIKDGLLQLILAKKEPAAARELLTKRFQNQLDQLRQQDSEDIFQTYINALTKIYDPHTEYLSARTRENFDINMSLSLDGIGAVLQKEDEYTKVVSVVPGGPADKQGRLGPGDRIIAVGQGTDGPMEDVIGWRLDDVVALIRGKKGTTVRIQLMPAKAETLDKTIQITLVRDRVKLEEQAAQSRVLELPSPSGKIKLGVIEIPLFYMDFEAYRNRDPDFKSTTRDAQKLISGLVQQDVQGIVLDLRNNGGGSLYEAIGLTNLFVDPGPVVQIRHANQSVSRELARHQAVYRGPLVVLVNRLSASASEIFAGAIQDYRRGLVIGSQTFGKGTVQSIAPLSEGQLKLTESKFYRVSGDSTQNRGVIPDIGFPSLYNTEDVGESSEKHALPWDRINGLPHRIYGDNAILIPKLRAHHLTRSANDPDWNFMLDELALVEKQRNQYVVSLNMKERQRAQETQERALFDLENKRRKAKGLPVFPSIQAWSDEETKKEEAAKASRKPTDKNGSPDPMLQEAGHILADYIALTSAPPTPPADRHKQRANAQR